MYHDGSNGSRARASRIRSSHDYEATELDSMRRRTRTAQRANAPRTPIAGIATLMGLLRSAPAGLGLFGVSDRR
jgi:hypothetical protein